VVGYWSVSCEHGYGCVWYEIVCGSAVWGTVCRGCWSKGREVFAERADGLNGQGSGSFHAVGDNGLPNAEPIFEVVDVGLFDIRIESGGSRGEEEISVGMKYESGLLCKWWRRMVSRRLQASLRLLVSDPGTASLRRVHILKYSRQTVVMIDVDHRRPEVLLVAASSMCKCWS
jgi:hypothetical protein